MQSKRRYGSSPSDDHDFLFSDFQLFTFHFLLPMCGIIAISAYEPVAQLLYDGLTTLQHRGQDAAGIATFDGKNFNITKGNGLVRDVFHTRHMHKLQGNSGIGHVRYPTAGSNSSENAQPFYAGSPFGITLGHNGNLTNAKELAKELFEKELRHLQTDSDSEVLLNIVAQAIRKENVTTLTPENVFSALTHVYEQVTGSFAVVAQIAGQGIIAFRDPYAIRPLVIGRQISVHGVSWMIASETVPITALEYEVVRDVQPGEVIFIDNNNEMHSKVVAKNPTMRPCIFEHVYFARPDAIIDGISVYKTRLRMGEMLAKQIIDSGIPVDVVIPIPDTSRTVALPLANELGVKYREGFIKNRYIGRTFIMPGQEMRQKSVRFKLNPIPLEFSGKHVLLVDDSIVRGTTCKKIIEMAREAGALSVAFASAAPPILNPCPYGVDMPSRKEFVANGLTTEEIRQVIGADHLFYQTLPDLVEAAHAGNRSIEHFCTACFSGEYPTPEITHEKLEEMEHGRRTTPLPVAEGQMTLV